MSIQTISKKLQLNIDEQEMLIYMNQHRNEVRNINIRKLAKRTFTFPNFIVKACKKMKLSGYSELVFLAADTPDFPSNTENDLEVESCVRPSSNLIDKYEGSITTTLGSGYSQNIVNYMNGYLNLNGSRCTSNSHLGILRKHKNTLVVIISNSEEAKRLIEFCIQAQRNNRDVVSSTRNRSLAIAKHSTLTMGLDTSNPISFDDHYPQLFLGLALIYSEPLMNNFLSN